MSRDYGGAISALNSLQSNPAIIEAFKNPEARQALNSRSIPEAVDWLRRIGYKPSDLNRLNPIHVAGTKGKGSTSTFISSILYQFTPSQSSSPRVNKVGLYTSPHLRFARERIKIDNEPLSEEQFARYFFEVWDRLDDAARAAGEDPSNLQTKPQYFRYLTLMAFHAYLSEGVNAAVIECGVGGEYDFTNVLEQPATTAITSLGIDHVALLGNTIEEIAWHKGGIIKANAKAFSIGQPPSAEKVLFDRAAAKGTELEIVSSHPDLKQDGKIKLGLAGDFQYGNAALAVATAGEYLRKIGDQNINPGLMEQPLPEPFRRGLEQAKLDGRCQTRHEKHVSWYLDGGHTQESIKLAGQWFASQIQANSSSEASAAKKLRVLIFNQQTRDSNSLAETLHGTLKAALGNGTPFTHVIFCTNLTYKESGYRPDLVSINISSAAVERLDIQKGLADKWNAIDHSADVRVYSTIEEAVDFTRDLASKEQGRLGGDEAPVMTFVTGSLHLVGGFLDVVETKPGPQ